jgi:hypothetical protein
MQSAGKREPIRPYRLPFLALAVSLILFVAVDVARGDVCSRSESPRGNLSRRNHLIGAVPRHTHSTL